MLSPEDMKRVVDEMEMDEDGLPAGMRKCAERAVSEIFGKDGEEVQTPTVGIFDYCPCCGADVKGGVRFTYGVMEFPHPTMVLWVRHEEPVKKSCVLLFSADTPVMNERAALLTRYTTALLAVRRHDEAKLKTKA